MTVYQLMLFVCTITYDYGISGPSENYTKRCEMQKHYDLFATEKLCKEANVQLSPFTFSLVVGSSSSIDSSKCIPIQIRTE